MDRRDFIKLVTSGIMATTVLKGNLLRAYEFAKKRGNHGQLSLSVLTDQPDTTIARCQKLLNQFDLNARALIFEDFVIPGEQVGDIVLVRNNALVDYRKPEDGFSRQVLQISHELALPREMNDPVLLKFTTPDDNKKAATINVYHKQMLVNQFDVNERLHGEEIPGTRGVINLSLKHQRAHIVATSCKHKTCMKMGSIYKPGQSLVCIPNELRIAVAGKNNLGIDDVVF